jgi:hypothetical protein
MRDKSMKGWELADSRTSVDEKSPFHSLTEVGPVLNECNRLFSTVTLLEWKVIE